MPVSLLSNDTIARLDLSHGQAHVDVLLFGAHVLSWKSHKGTRENLFCSSVSPLDGSAAVRGGIPIVFPVFGNPSDHAEQERKGLERLEKHGVARTRVWKLASHDDSASSSSGSSSATATFTLSSKDIKGIEDEYEWPFELVYKLTLTPDSLTTQLSITNSSVPGQTASSPKPMRFHSLLHNYLRVPSALTASVSGLRGQSYRDKLDGSKVKEQQEDPIVLNGRGSDAVYFGPAPSAGVDLLFNGAHSDDNDGVKGIRLTRTENWPNTTVWNPAEQGAKGIHDLHQGGWKEYICVEPGKVLEAQELPAGQTFVASQTLQLLLRSK